MIIYIGVTLWDEKFNLACLVLPVAIPVGGGSIEHRTIMEGYTASCCAHVLQCIPRYYPVVGRPIYGRQCCPLLLVDKKWSGVTRFPRLGIKGFVGLWGKEGKRWHATSSSQSLHRRTAHSWEKYCSSEIQEKYQNKKFLSSKTMLQLVGLFNSRYWVLIGYWQTGLG